MEWNPLLREQVNRHWTHQLRKRLDGLTDDEHINRELIHHLAEVCLLRDLHRRQEAS